MKYLLLLGALFLSSCATVETILNPPTSTEIQAEKLAGNESEWTEKQSGKLLDLFNQRLPLADGREMTGIPPDQLPQLKTKMASQIESLESRVNNFEGSMKELRHVHDSLKLTAQQFAKTERYIQGAIEDFGATYTREVQVGLSPTGRSEKGTEALSAYFFSSHPEYQEYMEWLSENQKAFSNLQKTAEAKGRSTEREKLISHIRSSECPQVTRISMRSGEIHLARGAPYTGDRPKEDIVYDLGNFRVLQSVGGGILLMPNYGDSYRAQPIFVQTSEDYADGFTFDAGDQLVCFTGKTKKYASITEGRKVYMFEAISISEQYYFLPWSE